MLLGLSCMNFRIDLSGAESDHLHYLQTNRLYSTELTSDVKRITLVRIAKGFVGYVQFRQLKTLMFTNRWMCNLFNTKVHENRCHVIYDFVNWSQKFEFDNSNHIFYDFLFE